eukprot:jgi/Psemu1/24826/gm1.24826_g
MTSHRIASHRTHTIPCYTLLPYYTILHTKQNNTIQHNTGILSIPASNQNQNQNHYRTFQSIATAARTRFSNEILNDNNNDNNIDTDDVRPSQQTFRPNNNCCGIPRRCSSSHPYLTSPTPT